MRWPAWTGVGERRFKKSPDEEVQPPKTAWDFLQLLIVPAILVVIALAFNASQASRERSREDRRIREDRALAEATHEDAVLDAYMARISNLILDRSLTSAKDGSAVSEVARTATLTTLRRLDGSRKGEVVRFLSEAGLLLERRKESVGVPDPPLFYWAAPVIGLNGADLRGADLAGADLYTDHPKHRILLNGDLRGARFDHALLRQVDFQAEGLNGFGLNKPTTFAHTMGQNVDFSDGKNLSTVRLGAGVKAHPDGADGRPKIVRSWTVSSCQPGRFP